MIDYTQVFSKNLNSTNIVGHNLLQFVVKNVSIDGEILKSKMIDKNGNPIYRTPYFESNYNHLKIVYTDNGNYKVSGSLHKFWNQENYNDFTIDDLKKSIIRIQDDFGINVNECKLEVLEIGLNIETSIDPSIILQSCFLHKTKPFENKIDSEKGKYIVCRHTQYQVICYNKSLQMKIKGIHINKHLMRFEIRFTKMEKLNKLGLFNLGDLLDFEYDKFIKILLDAWMDILFYDPVLLGNSINYHKYSNPLFWKELLSRDSKSAFYKHKNKLNKMNKDYNGKLKGVIERSIVEKAYSLIHGGTSFDPLSIMSN